MRYADVMRTTVNLDPEALSKARLLARQQGLPLGTVISRLILKATRPTRTSGLRNGVPVFPARRGQAPDLATVNRLRDESP